MKTYTFFDRMASKSLVGSMTSYFQNNYKLSPKAAETICNDTIAFSTLFGNNTRSNGQIVHFAVKLGEPASKSIKECHLVPVKLTLIAKDDLSYLKDHGLKELNLRIIVRISREAIDQGAVLSVEDISYILRMSSRTIKRYRKIARSRNLPLILRGDVADMGPASTHRSAVIKLFLQGYSETEIAQRLSHQLEHVEKYIYDFLRVAILKEDGYYDGNISRLVKLSKSKVLAIVALYNELQQDDYYLQPLQTVLQIYRFGRTLKKRVIP